jgi:hypothetical protein
VHRLAARWDSQTLTLVGQHDFGGRLQLEYIGTKCACQQRAWERVSLRLNFFHLRWITQEMPASVVPAGKKQTNDRAAH